MVKAANNRVGKNILSCWKTVAYVLSDCDMLKRVRVSSGKILMKSEVFDAW